MSSLLPGVERTQTQVHRAYRNLSGRYRISMFGTRRRVASCRSQSPPIAAPLEFEHSSINSQSIRGRSEFRRQGRRSGCTRRPGNPRIDARAYSWRRGCRRSVPARAETGGPPPRRRRSPRFGSPRRHVSAERSSPRLSSQGWNALKRKCIGPTGILLAGIA